MSFTCQTRCSGGELFDFLQTETVQRLELGYVVVGLPDIKIENNENTYIWQPTIFPKHLGATQFRTSGCA